MPEFIFVKEDYFDKTITDEKDKTGLARVASETFSDFATLENSILAYNAHIVKKLDKPVPHIPYVVNRLPVHYEFPNGELVIGHVEFHAEDNKSR